MKTTKILALLLAVLMAFGCLAACTEGGSTNNGDETDGTGASGSEVTELTPWSEEFISAWGSTVAGEATDGAIKLTVWGPEAAQDVLKEEVARFSTLFKDYANITIEVAVQGEGDAANQVQNDPKAAADVFGFASDQLNKLVDAKTLAEVVFADEAYEMNSEASSNAATINDVLYAYPETGDNSYFLTYDTRVVSEEQAKSLESVLEACKTADKKFIMNAGDGYFACMYLYTGGLQTLGLEDDGITQKFNDYDVDQVVASVSAFANLFRTYNGTFESGDVKLVADGFKNDPTTVGAGIVGSWNVAAVKEALTDDDGNCYAGFATLPTINIDGTDTQIINMFGYKFLGVNSQSSYPLTAQLLAFYLTNEECQLERAEELEWGPSNINVQNSEFVQNNQSMAAILAQAEYSMPQTGICSTFWNPIAALGNYIIDAKSDISEEALKTQVEACIVAILDE